MKTNSVTPIKKQIVVEAARDRAFRVFTQNIDSWWPRQHHIGKSALQAAVMEPKVNGRWYEKGEDGSECEWGKVIAWEPPHRIVLAWQISAAWQFDPNLVTLVEVRFTEQGPKRTLVELEHRDLERFAESAEQLRGMLDSGWGTILALYAEGAQRS